MKLIVAFITYNNLTLKYLDYFLPSLKEALGFLSNDDYKVIAWDNSESNPNNRLAIENFNRLQGNLVEYQKQESNLGFSAAYNILIKQAIEMKGKYFLLINPDTLLSRGSIREMVQALESDANLASVSPKILHWDFVRHAKTNMIDSMGIVLNLGLQFSDLGQGQKDSGQFDNANILGPSGAAGMFRLSALEKVEEKGQYFDERFFMYKEDCDLNYRLYLIGLTSRLVSQAIIYHDRSVSTSGLGFWSGIVNRQKKSRQVRAWSFFNQHIIFFKYWKKQNSVNKFEILLRVLSMFVFSLIFERFLLKEYRKLLSVL